MKQLPRFPFTTPLSGSARETELRIRSIFQWADSAHPCGPWSSWPHSF